MSKLFHTLFLLLIMVCCVAAVSAADIEQTDDVSDEIVVDEVTDVVEDVETDSVDDDTTGEESLGTTTGTINGYNYTRYFDANGNLNDSDVWELTFNGYFDEVDSTFGNFKINKQVAINLSNATFHNIGFDLSSANINLNGGIFNTDANTLNNAVINVYADNVVVNNTVITISAPENENFYAIDVENASNVRLLNNIITYNCGYANSANYNYAIKAKNSSNVNIISNNITVAAPLKTPNWDYWMSIDADYVAGVAIENCDNAKFVYNNLTVIVNNRTNVSTTLDAFIIAGSQWAHIENNTIVENDVVTATGDYSYIYGIDVYSCNGIIIKNNTVTMNGNESGGHIGGNGTGAAYCIQLSGEYSSATISYNTLTTTNQGPNLAIYAQNYAELNSWIAIYGNIIDVTGKAGNDPWSLVSGIESQIKSSYIYNNIIHVNNTAGYAEDNYAFGISYSQWLNGTHYYYINNNTVDVINADYAVYLLNNTNVSGSITRNHLIAYNDTGYNPGDKAIFARDEIYKYGND